MAQTGLRITFYKKGKDIAARKEETFTDTFATFLNKNFALTKMADFSVHSKEKYTLIH